VAEERIKEERRVLEEQVAEERAELQEHQQPEETEPQTQEAVLVAQVTNLHLQGNRVETVDQVL